MDSQQTQAEHQFKVFNQKQVGTQVIQVSQTGKGFQISRQKAGHKQDRWSKHTRGTPEKHWHSHKGKEDLAQKEWKTQT